MNRSPKSDSRAPPLPVASPRASPSIAKFLSPKQLSEMSKRMTRQRRAFVAPPTGGLWADLQDRSKETVGSREARGICWGRCRLAGEHAR